eukprot:1161049-Pelagomonas_calceolata.AAC.12
MAYVMPVVFNRQYALQNLEPESACGRSQVTTSCIFGDIIPLPTMKALHKVKFIVIGVLSQQRMLMLRNLFTYPNT